MPTLGADMTKGTLVAWRKNVGDRVTKGDIIAEVETDKATIEVEVFTTGVIERLLVQPGDTVPVGTPMAIIKEEGAAKGPRLEGRGEEASETAPAAAAATASATEAGRLRISPAAKRLAAELGVDLASVHGTGPEGAITREDVQRAARQAPRTGREAPGPESPAPSPVPPAGDAADRLVRMRHAIAAAMTRSKREIPHYYLGTTIDLGRAMAWLKEENAKRPVTERLLASVLLIKAVALAVREVPELNAIWKEGRVVQSRAVHVGVAISLRQGGLVAPALHDADRRSLTELMVGLRDLVMRARSGSLRSSELSDPTITVTNLGEQGVETVFGVIYPPQVALVGFGKVVERPWVVGGAIVPRPVVTATLSADHRVSDGHRGGLFLATVDRLLQEPERL